MARSQAVILIATSVGRQQDWVNRELQEAGARPLLALVEQGVQLLGVPAENAIAFDRFGSYTNAIQLAATRLRRLALQQQDENLLAGVLIGGLILLLVSGMGGGNKK